MRKFLVSLISFFLSGIIFFILFSNSIKISTESILSSVYDHASPESRAKKIQEIREACSVIELSGYTNVVIETKQPINLTKLQQSCKKNLDDKSLFLEFGKMQMDDIEKEISNKPFSKYVLNSKPNFKTFLFLLFLCIFLFFVEQNYLEFLKSLGKILFFTSLFGIFIYFLPTVLEHFINVDTSFLFEIENSAKIIGPEEIFIVLTPIVLSTMLSRSLLIYSLILLGSSILFFIFVSIQNKLIANRNNNTVKGS